MMKPGIANLQGLLFFTFSAIFAAQAAPQSVEPLRAAQIAQLQTWGATGKVGSQSPLNLDVRAADLSAARATGPLQNWVRNGGIIVLHTDAAQAFGFATAQSRERTFNRAGQLWGRGENALPFGGSPLLFGGRSQSQRGQTDGVPGVRTVYYQLQSGDALLTNSNAAVVPLLRVEDNTLPENNKAEPTFYAAAMRRYGKGWALFLPRTIEARADGAQFQQNLEAFIAQASEGKWQTLDVAAIQAAYPAASRQQNVDWQQLSQALQPLNDPKVLPAVSDEAQLVLSTADVNAVSAALKQIEAAPNDDGLQTSGRALVYLMAARVLWQQDNNDTTPNAETKLAALWDTSSAAREQLWQTQSGGPTAAMARWWNGVFALGAALPPTPTRYEPEIIAFSYAHPALEAAQWWQQVKSNDESLTKIVPLAGAAAQQMAQQHQDDPPLLSYWKTRSGTNYLMQLAPIQVASNQFPPSPQDWGMPPLVITKTTFYAQLIPIGGANAMPLGIVSQPLVFPAGNSVRSQMFWLCSQIWSEDLETDWNFRGNKKDILLSAMSVNIFRSTKSGTKFEASAEEHGAFLKNEKLYLRYMLNPAMPSWDAFAKQMRTYPEGTEPDTERDYLRDYSSFLFENWGGQEVMSESTPARGARLQAHLLTEFWNDKNVPSWMDEGLQNVFSISMGDIIRSNSSDLKAITPFPPIESLLLQIPRRSLASSMLPYALRESIASTDAEVEPVATEQNDGFGAQLDRLDSTNQVAYFYKRFGAGAFIETLQRLGSGQSIDAALQTTTGLTEQQFFAAAAAN